MYILLVLIQMQITMSNIYLNLSVVCTYGFQKFLYKPFIQCSIFLFVQEITEYLKKRFRDFYRDG